MTEHDIRDLMLLADSQDDDSPGDPRLREEYLQKVRPSQISRLCRIALREEEPTTGTGGGMTGADAFHQPGFAWSRGPVEDEA